MRPRKIILLAAIAFGTAYFVAVSHVPEVKAPKLQNGDIIFRKENSFWGDVSASVARRSGKYSHAGVILIQKNKVFVIHSYADTNNKKSVVSMESLQDFAKNATNIGYYRLNFPQDIRTDIAKSAFEYFKKKIPFDDKFIYYDNTALYCTELVWSAVKKASGYDIAPHKSVAMGKVFIGNDDLFLGGFMTQLPN